MKLELFTSVGQDEPIPLGSVHVSLDKLYINNSRNDTSAVISQPATFYYENLQIGVVDLKMRMRFPIFEYIKWNKEKANLGLASEEEKAEEEIDKFKRKRKLVIAIDKAIGCEPKSRVFVYYSLNKRVENIFE